MRYRRIPYENGHTIIYEYGASSANDTVQTCTFQTLLDDGDVLGDAYQLVRASTGDIEGEFSAEFVKWLYLGEKHDPASPDTLIFTNETYHARVQQ